MTDADRTRLYFPLRTSVELFRDPASPAAHVRAKQGAILYDEIGFETGVYDVTMAGGGASHMWRPASGLTDDELREARHIHETGAPFALMIGEEPERGGPAPPEAMRTIIQGQISRHYVAEWESVLRELRALSPPWAVEITMSDAELNHLGLTREIGDRNFALLGDKTLMPDAPRELPDWTYKMFNRDAAVAEKLSATMNVTSQFLPMVERSGAEPVSAGEHALEVFAPNLGGLRWDSVVEFRDHAGCDEAREKLREFEQRALAEDPASLDEFRLRLGQEITRDFQQAFKDMKPSIGLDVFREAVSTAVSIIMPPVGSIAALAETAKDARRHERSWRTALMKLTPAN